MIASFFDCFDNDWKEFTNFALVLLALVAFIGLLDETVEICRMPHQPMNMGCTLV